MALPPDRTVLVVDGKDQVAGQEYQNWLSVDIKLQTVANCTVLFQVLGLLEGPMGMALYEWKDGKIGQQCIQGGTQHDTQPALRPCMMYAWLRLTSKLPCAPAFGKHCLRQCTSLFCS